MWMSVKQSWYWLVLTELAGMQETQLAKVLLRIYSESWFSSWKFLQYCINVHKSKLTLTTYSDLSVRPRRKLLDFPFYSIFLCHDHINCKVFTTILGFCSNFDARQPI